MSEFDRLLADPSSEPLPAVAPGRVLEPDRIIQPGRIDSPDLPPRRYTGDLAVDGRGELLIAQR